MEACSICNVQHHRHSGASSTHKLLSSTASTYSTDLSTVNLLTVYTGRLINKIGYFSNRVTNSVLLAIHDMLVNQT